MSDADQPERPAEPGPAEQPPPAAAPQLAGQPQPAGQPEPAGQPQPTQQQPAAGKPSITEESPTAGKPETEQKPETGKQPETARWRPRRPRLPRPAPRPAQLARLLMPAEPPPGPFRRSFWRSPVRGPWLTSMLGLVLLGGITILFVTGLLSYASYNPNLGGGNDYTSGKGWLGFYLFSWPTDPAWAYQLNQGLHVTLGVALVPILLAKLWSVLPKLFEWPPLRSPAHALERISLFLLVGGGVFEFATGIMNIQQWYVFPGSFYHAALLRRVGLHRRLRRARGPEDAHGRSGRCAAAGCCGNCGWTPPSTVPEPPDVSSLVPTAPVRADDFTARRARLRRGGVTAVDCPVGGPVDWRAAAPDRAARAARPGDRQRAAGLPDQRDGGRGRGQARGDRQTAGGSRSAARNRPPAPRSP